MTGTAKKKDTSLGPARAKPMVFRLERGRPRVETYTYIIYIYGPIEHQLRRSYSLIQGLFVCLSVCRLTLGYIDTVESSNLPPGETCAHIGRGNFPSLLPRWD